VALKKKVFVSLRLCVSSLHRDHANLLCIFKRLFNVAARRQDRVNAKFLIYKLYFFSSKRYSTNFEIMADGLKRHYLV